MKARLYSKKEWNNYLLAKACRRSTARLVKCRSRPSLRRNHA